MAAGVYVINQKMWADEAYTDRVMVSGRLFDSKTQQSVAGATITISSSLEDGSSQTQLMPITAISESMGQFDMALPEGADYDQITIEKNGYITYSGSFIFDSTTRQPKEVLFTAPLDPGSGLQNIHLQTIMPGWNLISSPLKPSDADPKTYFTYYESSPTATRGFQKKYIPVEGNLYHFDNNSQGMVTYSEYSPEEFGNIQEGKGYWLKYSGQDARTVLLKGEANGYDKSILIPKAGWAEIGSPYRYSGYWNNLRVMKDKNTGTEEIKSLFEAVKAGWIKEIKYSRGYDTQDIIALNIEDNSQKYFPGKGYWIQTGVDNITLQALHPKALTTSSLYIEVPEDVSLIDVLNTANPERESLNTEQKNYLLEIDRKIENSIQEELKHYPNWSKDIIVLTKNGQEIIANMSQLYSTLKNSDTSSNLIPSAKAESAQFEIIFDENSWGAETSSWQSWADNIKPRLVEIFGQPFIPDSSIRVKKLSSNQPEQGLSGKELDDYYDLSRDMVLVNPESEFLNNYYGRKTAIIHELGHAFEFLTNRFQRPDYSEGLVHSLAKIYQLKYKEEAQPASLVNQYIEKYNKAPFSFEDIKDLPFADSQIDGGIGMVSQNFSRDLPAASWIKAYIENPNFFREYHSSLYLEINKSAELAEKNWGFLTKLVDTIEAIANLRNDYYKEGLSKEEKANIDSEVKRLAKEFNDLYDKFNNSSEYNAQSATRESFNKAAPSDIEGKSFDEFIDSQIALRQGNKASGLTEPIHFYANPDPCCQPALLTGDNKVFGNTSIYNLFANVLENISNEKYSFAPSNWFVLDYTSNQVSSDVYTYLAHSRLSLKDFVPTSLYSGRYRHSIYTKIAKIGSEKRIHSVATDYEFFKQGSRTLAQGVFGIVDKYDSGEMKLKHLDTNQEFTVPVTNGGFEIPEAENLHGRFLATYNYQGQELMSKKFNKFAGQGYYLEFLLDKEKPEVQDLSVSMSGQEATAKIKASEAVDGLFIVWPTNNNGESKDSESNYLFTKAKSLPDNQNTFILQGLDQPSYSYQLIITDTSGNYEIKDGSFFGISNINSVNTGTGATISWDTSIPTKGQIQYGETTNYGYTTQMETTSGSSHSQNINDLALGKTYHYRIKATAEDGSISYSEDKTFATLGITNIRITPNTRSVTVSWETPSIDTTGVVKVGTTESYGTSVPTEGGAKQSHSVTIPGLNPATDYHLRIEATPASGALFSSEDQTFRTQNTEVSYYSLQKTEVKYNLPPAYKDIALALDIAKGTRSAGPWTSYATPIKVNYSCANGVTCESHEQGMATDTTSSAHHEIALANLKPDTTYQYTVTGKNNNGEDVTVGQGAFRTYESISEVDVKLPDNLTAMTYDPSAGGFVRIDPWRYSYNNGSWQYGSAGYLRKRIYDEIDWNKGTITAKTTPQQFCLSPDSANEFGYDTYGNDQCENVSEGFHRFTMLWIKDNTGTRLEESRLYLDGVQKKKWGTNGPSSSNFNIRAWLSHGSSGRLNSVLQFSVGNFSHYFSNGQTFTTSNIAGAQGYQFSSCVTTTCQNGNNFTSSAGTVIAAQPGVYRNTCNTYGSNCSLPYGKLSLNTTNLQTTSVQQMQSMTLTTKIVNTSKEVVSTTKTRLEWVLERLKGLVRSIAN